MQNKYPLWKNALLVVIAIVGFVYAAPNLYREYPVVQVSSEKGVESGALMKMVSDVLHQKHIASLGVTPTDDGVLVRFSSPDLQLAGRDVIRQLLGSDYTVALNLSTSTPRWMRAIGAAPMKQGLDLRGGVHFLLEVDIESLIARRYEGLSKRLGQDLRATGVRYAGIRYIPTQGVVLHFRQAALMQRALSTLQSENPNLSFVSTVATNTITVTLLPTELNEIRQSTIEQTMSILRNRVNELGVGEAVVQQQGATRVAVDLPGIQDATRAKQILGGTATLEFHLVDAEHDPAQVKQSGLVPVDSKLYMMDARPLLLKRLVVLSGDSISSAVSSFDQQTATPAVSIQLGGGGESYFTKVTRENIGKRMAIVFVETKTRVEGATADNKHITWREERVISAPVIQSALGASFQITGLVDAKEAANLALLLRAGALPAAIFPIEERTIGPSLGKENIHRGVVSLAVGMGLILVVMVLYYQLFGMISNVALVLNLVLLTALLSIIDATLTLPGIAGIVLTVGMAVDANVLIYERIREELRRGMTPQAAIHAGYDRAFSTILDANLTTLIVGVVLFAIGTGPVRGFAVTLCLGLVTSMLTGVTYTRGMVNLMYGGRAVKRLSIGI